MSGTNEFIASLERFEKKVAGQEDRFMREFCFDLAEKVVENTPVLTGFLRSNWNASISVPDYSLNGSGMASVALNLARAKATDTIFISNGTKYGPFVEFGTSRMAPRAMVRRAVVQAQSIAANVVRRIAK